MSTSVGVWLVGDSPVRATKSKVGLEKDLESWIAADPSLLSEGIQIVGRQVGLEGGFLDLLAVDAGGRWLAIELKRGRLYREAVAQALDYAASLRTLDGEILREKLISGMDRLGNGDELESAIREQFEEMEDERDVAVVLVGTSVDPGLERVVEFLGNFDLPVSVVSFEVFELEGGSQLLVREVIEEKVTEPSETSKTKSVEQIRRQAVVHGVGPEFDRIVSAAEAAGLHVRPYVRSVMLTPPNHRYRFLMAARPQSGSRMKLTYGPDAFAEFFLDVAAKDVIDSIGDHDGGVYTGEDLEDRVAAFEGFLAELPSGPSLK